MPAQPDYINEELMLALSKYLRLTNYLAAAQLYLKDNYLLERELSTSDIKERILGHWGTVPGINFIYACLNILIKQYNQEMMLIIGPGHGYPALLSNLYVEGSFGEFYPEHKWSKSGVEQLIKKFSWPGGFPSHSNPETPGVIHEGGELGYALATAFGAAFDNPDLIVPCIVGDGEAETGPTATAWHSNKFINPKEDGAVLPIVHINKYKISGPTIYGTMSREELEALFTGLGYEPIWVSGDILYETMLSGLDHAYHSIKSIQKAARENNQIDKPRWPVILFTSKKGWTGPKEHKGLPIEDSFRSHGIPLEHVINDEDEFQLLKSWLESYKVGELFDDKFNPIEEIRGLIPKPELRLGMTKHGNGGAISQPLKLPEDTVIEKTIQAPAKALASNMQTMGEYMRELVRNNPTNFRIMSPDETESNKLNKLFEVTKRRYIWPVPWGSENISPEGRVMEILSEHTLEGWLQGYLLTGRHGIFISYEAFVMIIASMVDQYSKFLKQMKPVSWRKPLPSLNIVLTSTSWRQDHNGFSHQNPGFISTILNDYLPDAKVFFPADANMVSATLETCFTSKSSINVIVSCKREIPQYLTLAEAREQMTTGIKVWKWVDDTDDPDVVFTASGDYATQESLAAITILKDLVPQFKARFVSISELTCFGIGENRKNTTVNEQQFQEIFTSDREIIYSYHGYPEDIQALIFQHPAANRFHIHGYIEEGTTTTPFDMQMLNKSSRYDLVLEALEFASVHNPQVKERKEEITEYIEGIIAKHHDYIRENGVDIPEIKNFKF